MEQLDYNLLFRWFVGLGMDDARLGAHDVHEESRSAAGRRHRRGVLRRGVDPRRHRAAALGRAFHRRWHAAGGVGESEELSAARPGPAGGRRRQSDRRISMASAARNATHQSTTDPDARLYKKARGREARLGYLGHVLMEHRSGLIVEATVTPADGHGERDAALVMIARRAAAAIGSRWRPTKAYDTRDFVAGLRAMHVTPHVAQHTRPAPRQCDRCAHDAARRLRGQSTEAEARRARLRLDEDGRRAPQTATPRRPAGRPGSSPSPRRRTTSSGCAACCRRLHDGRRDARRSISTAPRTPHRQRSKLSCRVTISAAC